MKPLFLIFVFFFTSIYAKEVVDSNTGTAFPSEVTFTQDGKEYRLNSTGVSTRKKFFVKVYSVAHYLQEGAKGNDPFQLILQDDVAKQLTLKWLLDAPAEKVVEGYRESFSKVFSDADAARLKSEIETYIQFFNHNIAKGTEQILRWTPGGNLEVLFDGKSVGHLTNKDFVKGLWEIWVGPKSVVNRDKLVAQTPR